MKFMLMVQNREDEVAKLPPEEIERVVQAHAAYSAALEKAGVKVDRGFRLRPGAEMIRIKQDKGSRSTHDGPHPETKEVVGGFYLLECETRQEAIEWASKCPMWDCDTLELRPVWEM